jgi:hypothetical protein
MVDSGMQQLQKHTRRSSFPGGQQWGKIPFPRWVCHNTNKPPPHSLTLMHTHSQNGECSTHGTCGLLMVDHV